MSETFTCALCQRSEIPAHALHVVKTEKLCPQCLELYDSAFTLPITEGGQSSMLDFLRRCKVHFEEFLE